MQSKTPTRALLADDHEVALRGLRALLEGDGIEICGEARDGQAAVALASELTPDLAVIDISMPQLNGVEATRRIRAASPRTAVLIVTMHESEDILREAFRAGAGGCVLKSSAGEDLVAAAHLIRAGKPYVSAALDYLRGGPDLIPAPRRTLTQRERQILQLLAEGRTNKDIAVDLNISVKTAVTHRSNILGKLGLHSLPALVRYAVRNRIIEA